MIRVAYTISCGAMCSRRSVRAAVVSCRSEVALGDAYVLKQANSDLPRGMPRDKQSVMGEGKTRPDPAMLHVAADGVKVPLGANARLGSARLGSAHCSGWARGAAALHSLLAARERVSSVAQLVHGAWCSRPSRAESAPLTAGTERTRFRSAALRFGNFWKFPFGVRRSPATVGSASARSSVIRVRVGRLLRRQARRHGRQATSSAVQRVHRLRHAAGAVEVPAEGQVPLQVSSAVLPTGACAANARTGCARHGRPPGCDRSCIGRSPTRRAQTKPDSE